MRICFIFNKASKRTLYAKRYSISIIRSASGTTVAEGVSDSAITTEILAKTAGQTRAEVQARRSKTDMRSNLLWSDSMISAAGASSPLPLLNPISGKLYHAFGHDISCSLLGQTNVLYFEIQTIDLAGTQNCAIRIKHMGQTYSVKKILQIISLQAPANVRIRLHLLPNDGKRPRDVEKLFFCDSTGLVIRRTVSKRSLQIA